MLDHHSALIHVMVLVSAADADMTDKELETIGENVRYLPIFEDFDVETLTDVTRACTRALADAEVVEVVGGRDLHRARAFGRVGVVVGDLVIVPDREPRRRGMGGLQVAVELVERITIAELRQRRRNANLMPSHQPRSPGLLVDVVAEVDHQVEVARGHVAIGREVALLVLLARGEGEAQPLRRARGGRRGARATDRTLRRARPEPVPVGTPRFQAARLRMNRMGQRRDGLFGAARDDPGKGLVLGDLPVDRDRGIRHAAAFERLRREPRPKHDAVLARRARGDTEGEGIAGESRRCRARDREGSRDHRATQ